MEKDIYKNNIGKIVFFAQSGYPQIKAYGDKLEWGSSFSNFLGYRGTNLDGTVKILEKTTTIFFEKVKKRIEDVLENQELQTGEHAVKAANGMLKMVVILNSIAYIKDCYVNRYKGKEHPGISDLCEFHEKTSKFAKENLAIYSQLCELFERILSPLLACNEPSSYNEEVPVTESVQDPNDSVDSVSDTITDPETSSATPEIDQ